MKKIMTVVLTVLFLLAVSTGLFAEDYVRGKWSMTGKGAGHQDRRGELALFAKLNLNKDQKVRIKALRDSHMESIKPLREQMQSKRDDLKQLWLQPNPDKEKILAAQKEIREIRDQIEDVFISYRVDVFNVLTPEQQARAKDMLTKHGAGPGPGRMGPGRGMMDY